MFTVEQLGEYLRVAGYPDGSDWWIAMPDAHYYHGRGNGCSWPDTRSVHAADGGAFGRAPADTDDPLEPRPAGSYDRGMDGVCGSGRAGRGELLERQQSGRTLLGAIGPCGAVVEKNVKRLEGWMRPAGWQPDGEAFWGSTNGFLTCVGVNGTVSPRLYTERWGLESGSVLPVAARWQEVVPLERRKARVIYSFGSAIFNGAPSAKPYAPHAIPTAWDHWQPPPDDSAARDRAAAKKRVEAMRDERRRVVIPFAGWSQAGVVAAIDALTKEVNEDLPRRAVDDEIRVVFASSDGDVSEEQFFAEVEARFPGAAPAIRRLIDRYSEVAQRHDHLFSLGEEGIGIFASAVKTLGVLDASALPTLQRYGEFVDPEHEYYFAGTTVPAVIKAHGWTEDVVDFVFWVLAWNYYNTLDHYGEVWSAWGLRDAVAGREPRAFARHIAGHLADAIRMKDDPGRYGTGGLDKLAKDIPHPNEPWTAAFFAKLQRIFAEPGGTDH